MAGPTSVSLNNNNVSMYDAFKALTTNRDKNRGTIEVSVTGGVTELKCTQHHFYSSSTIRPNADLNNALAKAIAEGIDQISDKLIQGVLEGSDGAAATDKANQFLSFMHQVAEKLTAKLYVDNGGTPELRAMSRNAIQEIVSRIEEMKKYSAAELQKIGVDNLCSPNALKTAGEETAVGLSNRRLPKTAALLRTLNDDTICKEAAKMDFSLQNCGVGAVENRPVARCKENPFMMKAGETLDIVNAVQKENPKFKICTQVCADAKHYACGVFVPWGSQEETIVRDMDPMASAHLKGKGLIRPEIFSVTTPTKHESQYRFAYTQGEGRLSTSSGYMMKSKLGSVKSDFLFSSLPALGEEWQGMDTVGNTDYYCIARKQSLGREVSEGERAKANDLFDHLCELHISKRAGLDVGQFKEVMMLLMFGDIDLAAGDKKQIVADAIKAVKTGAYDKAKVATGYENAIRQTIRGWIDTARNRGVTCFVGSAVGCGVFNNDVRIVAKVFAEEFVSRAGDMKFVYAQYVSPRTGPDPCANVFEAAFNTAYETLAQYRNEKFSPANAFDYAKHKNQAGHVLSFGKNGGSDPRPFFAGCVDASKISSPGYINKAANELFYDSNLNADEICLRVVRNLNKITGSEVPGRFSVDFPRLSNGIILPDGTRIKASSEGKDLQACYDSIAEKMTKGRVKHYKDLKDKDLKLVQFTMAMLNQDTTNPMDDLRKVLLAGESGPNKKNFLFDNPQLGFQVSFNADGGVTFKGFYHSQVRSIADPEAVDAEASMIHVDPAKSDLGYSYEITYSAEKLDAILGHDWSDQSANWLTADNREFYYSCHIEA